MAALLVWPRPGMDMETALKKLLLVLGTRPEAIKMAPVLQALRRRADVQVTLCVTGQHREMLDQVLQVFQLRPDVDLQVMRPNQDLAGLTSAILHGVGEVIASERPDVVLVHGDTTTTFASTLAAFYARTQVGHVEAGLRSGELHSPWPEEMNRKAVSVMADYHFAPTQQAHTNLLREGVAEDRIWVTGNTVIDALQWVAGRIDADVALAQGLAANFDFLANGRRMVLVTGHRRENHGAGIREVCSALRAIAARGDVEVVYPVHLNPNISGPVREALAAVPHVHLIAPQSYLEFVWLMKRASLILTDSGGIQEEAPALGKPVLVMRDNTERPEAISAGTARLVGTRSEVVEAAVAQLLDEPAHYAAMAGATNPFGDGQAAERIAGVLLG